VKKEKEKKGREIKLRWRKGGSQLLQELSVGNLRQTKNRHAEEVVVTVMRDEREREREREVEVSEVEGMKF